MIRRMRFLSGTYEIYLRWQLRRALFKRSGGPQ